MVPILRGILRIHELREGVGGGYGGKLIDNDVVGQIIAGSEHGNEEDVGVVAIARISAIGGDEELRVLMLAGKRGDVEIAVAVAGGAGQYVGSQSFAGIAHLGKKNG